LIRLSPRPHVGKGCCSLKSNCTSCIDDNAMSIATITATSSCVLFFHSLIAQNPKPYTRRGEEDVNAESTSTPQRTVRFSFVYFQAGYTREDRSVPYEIRKEPASSAPAHGSSLLIS